MGGSNWFEITGIDKHGNERTIRVSADSSESAITIAESKGIVTTSIEAVEIASIQFEEVQPVDVIRLRRIAKYHRLVLLSMVAQLLTYAPLMLTAQESGSMAVFWLSVIPIVAAVVFGIVAVVMLVNEVSGSAAATVTGVLMLVPCISLFVLAIASTTAVNFLKRAGVRVGFLGVNPDYIH